MPAKTREKATAHTIKHCFEHIGFNEDNLSQANNEEDIPLFLTRDSMELFVFKI